MRRTVCLALAASVVLASPLFAQDTLPAGLHRAESALDAGRSSDAVDLALNYLSSFPKDGRGWLVLGRAYLASDRVDARAKAVEALVHATESAPDSPDVWDWLGQAGWALSGTDGEWYVRTASERLFALDPARPGAWDRWLSTYRTAADRERALALLSAHREIPVVRGRMARVLVELERYAEADTLLNALLPLEPANAEWLALRAQSAFESGDTAAGFAFYDRAVSHADLDSAGFLWGQVVGIASPAEIRVWAAGVRPETRPAFFRRFWASRDPDLFDGHNQRIAEHFARLRVARREFPLRFPFTTYQHSTLARAVSAQAGYGDELFYYRCEAQEVPGGPTRAEDRLHTPLSLVPGGVPTAYFPLGPTSALALAEAPIQPPGTVYIDPEKFSKVAPAIAPSFFRTIRDVDSAAAALGYNLRTGLDDRGTTYLRFGPPARRTIGAPNTQDPFCLIRDLERWTYDDIGTVRFFRPEAINVGGMAGWTATGDLVYRPMSEGQFEAVSASLTEDETAIPAPLAFGVWTAQFSGSDPGQTDVAVVTTRGAVAAQLVGGAASPAPPTRDSSGVVVLRSPPGAFLLVTTARVADTLGRSSLVLAVRALGGKPGISDLVVAPSWSDTVVTRTEMLQRVGRDLTFRSDGRLRSYAELYGMTPGTDGHVRYRATYQFYRTADLARAVQRRALPGATVLSFSRDRPGAPAVAEWLDIGLARLEPGRYLLRLDIREEGGSAPLARTQLGFEVLRSGP